MRIVLLAIASLLLSGCFNFQFFTKPEYIIVAAVAKSKHTTKPSNGDFKVYCKDNRLITVIK